IAAKGGKIQKQEPVSNLTRRGEMWQINGVRYDTVVSTIPPQELERLGGPAAPHIPYQGAACMTLAMDRQVTKGIYWLNMKILHPMVQSSLILISSQRKDTVSISFILHHTSRDLFPLSWMNGCYQTSASVFR